MYFENRSQAGQRLANVLYDHYRYEDCAVLALTPGGVLVGEQIAARLHSPLMMLLSESVDIPGEGMAIGAVSESGRFTYNSTFSEGQIGGFTSEFHGYFDEKKREVFNKLNKLVGDGSIVDETLLQNRNIIAVSDGFYDPSIIDVTLDFLKPIRTSKVVFAAPIATIPMVDRLHVAADELHILDVKENFFGVDHYYEDNAIPSVETIVAKISEIVLNWR